MKGLFIRRGHRHADDIENNAHHHDGKQNEKGHGKAAAVHHLVRDQRNDAGNNNRDQENGDDPADRLMPLPSGSLRVGFRHENSLLLRNIVNEKTAAGRVNLTA